MRLHQKSVCWGPGGEDILDAGPHARATGVAAGDVARRRLAYGPRAVERGLQAAPLEHLDVGGRAVGGTGPDAARRVARLERRAEWGAVVRGG